MSACSMQANPDHLHTALQRTFASLLQSVELKNDEITIVVSTQHLVQIMSQLHEAPDFKFEQLVDLAGVDYLEFGVDEWNTQTATSSGFSRGVEKASFGRFTFDDEPVQQMTDRPRYAVVYHLLSISRNQRLRVKVSCEDNDFPTMPSMTGTWASADWYEREAFDLYGIIFEGHPDLRRILTDYGFTGHPFRKDFPLVGHVEVRYDPEQKRVIYQPVSIEPRVTVPKVIRDDHRFEPAVDKPDQADV